MRRLILAAFAVAFAAVFAAAQEQPQQQTSKPSSAKSADSKPQDTKPKGKEVEEPPEEDESLLPQQCVLNPLQAQRDMTAGDFYFKRSKYGSAAPRYKDATCWDPTSSQAFLKLGEAEEKLHNFDEAREAYKKYLELAPEAKNAGDIKKRLARLLVK